jgi:urease accessory protein
VIQFLQLMQLSDSALPIGTAAHSFGLESLAEWDEVRADTLELFLKAYLQEQALLEVSYCRSAHKTFALGATNNEQMAVLCARLSATKPAKESRDGSISLGNRLLAVCHSILPEENARALTRLFQNKEPHHAIVFGYIGAMLNFDEDLTVAAFLQQTVAALISAAQRLLPVGQRQAAAALWNLKPEIIRVVERCRNLDSFATGSFMPMTEIASMRHPRLETRLFLS